MTPPKKWLVKLVHSRLHIKDQNLFLIFYPFIRIICLYPVQTLLALYLLQVFFVVFTPPLQLFGPNRLRDYLALKVFSSIGPSANHQLAGVLTYFKQQLNYLSFIWYFFLFRLRLKDKGNPPAELRQINNWGAKNIRLVFVLGVLAIWIYRFFISTGYSEPIWGTTGRGVVSGFYVFLKNPNVNYKYFCMSIYRFLEVIGFLYPGLVCAFTFPMFLKLGQKNYELTDINQDSVEAKIGRILFQSASFIPLAITIMLMKMSNSIGIGELSVNDSYIWFILLFLTVLCILSLNNAWNSIRKIDSPAEVHLGRMFKWILTPLIITLLFGVINKEPFKKLENDPIHKAKTMRSKAIGYVGYIFQWNLEIREDFRKRLDQLITSESVYAYNDESPCDLTTNKERLPKDIRRICIQTQIITFYGLDIFTLLLGDDWYEYLLSSNIKTTKDSILYKYVKTSSTFRSNLIENYKSTSKYEKPNSKSRDTFLGINRLNHLEQLNLTDESLQIYQKLRPVLISEFNSYVGM